MRWIGIGIVSFVTLSSCVAPYLMRRDLLFGVTVPPEFRDTPAARAIIRRYQIRVYLCGFAAFALAVAFPELDRLWWLIAPLLAFLGSSVAFARAHQASSAHGAPPSGVREAELLRSRSLLEHPQMLLAGPAILAAGFALVFSIPTQAGQIPLFAGWSAIVARWTAIGGLVEKPLSFSLGACLGSFLPLLAFRFGTRHNPTGVINYRRIMLRNIILFNAAFAALAVWAMGMGVLGRAVDKIEFRVALSVIFVGLAAHVVYLLVLRRKENMTLATIVGRDLGDRTPDELWLWGMFYHNPDDPVLFVEARVGPGYTVNFGRPSAWVMLAGFLILLVLPLVFK
jgi:hypothetical protein